jgi:hypothetical protein
LNSEPISHSDVTAEQRLSERRRISREHLRITWDRDVKLLQVIAKCLYVANAAETEERILIHEKANACCELMSTPPRLFAASMFTTLAVFAMISLLLSTSLDGNNCSDDQQDKPTD